MPANDKDELRDLILELTAKRGPDKTICPSEAARAYTDDWRDLMPVVRTAAGELQQQGKIKVLQDGNPVDIEAASGPVRLQFNPPTE
ncbi:MAG: DUF3253 domain-containing protein [bacterium]